MKPLKIIPPLHMARRRLELCMEAQLREHEVSFIEANLLIYLLFGSPASVGSLCEMTSLKPSTMTSILDRMQERGFIERTPNPDDRRSWLVSLAPGGKELAAKVRKLAEEFEGDVIAELDDADLAAYKRVFGAINHVTDLWIRGK